MGRHLKFKTVKELEEKIEAYFVKCDEEERPYTISGLAYALDTNRETLLNYEKREDYFDTVKRAKARVAAYVEERLFGNNATGPIFNLKNNFGWEDVQKNKNENSGKIEVVTGVPGEPGSGD